MVEDRTIGADSGTRWYRSETAYAFAIMLIVLVASIYAFPRWADPNQNSRLNMVLAVVDDGTFKIDKYVGNTVDYAKIENHYYSDKAPGAAFAGIPIYFALRNALDTPLLTSFTDRLATSDAFASTLRAEGSGVSANKVEFAVAQVVISFFVAALPTAILCALMFLLMSGVTLAVWPRLAVALGYGLLTPAFPYANALYGHQLAAALLFGAFFLAAYHRTSLGAFRLLAIGLLFGYAFVTEYPVALMIVVLGIYVWYRLIAEGHWLRIVWVAIGGIALAIPWMLYNSAIFGGPLSLGYSHSELWTAQHESGFMSLSLPTPAALWGISFSPFRGLFLLSPWLLLAMPGLVLWWRSRAYRAEWWAAVGCIVVMFLFNSSSIMWWGGFAIGPRYVLPMLPFLALPVLFALLAWLHRWWFQMTAFLLYASSFVTIWGLSFAEQAFPSDVIQNPLLDYALPNWESGNIARNLGTLLGLHGTQSLIPLIVFLVVAGLALLLVTKRPGVRNPDAPVRQGPSLEKPVG